MRDARRERDRYPRASLREQLGEELTAFLGNTPLVILVVVIVGGWLVLTFTRPEEVVIGQLAAGDCLYIRAADADTDTTVGRAIGSDGAVIAALFESGAERAPCDGSHSHEVADAWVLGDSLVACVSGPGRAHDPRACTVRGSIRAPCRPAGRGVQPRAHDRGPSSWRVGGWGTDGCMPRGGARRLVPARTGAWKRPVAAVRQRVGCTRAREYPPSTARPRSMNCTAAQAAHRPRGAHP